MTHSCRSDQAPSHLAANPPKYCSHSCHGKHAEYPAICKVCGKTFSPLATRTTRNVPECKICAQCGKPVKESTMKFCDQPCMALYFKEHPPRTPNLTSPYAIALAAGLTRYSPGKPCKHGHTSDFWVSTRTCIKCAQIVAAGAPSAGQWYKKNPEKARINRQQWRAENPGKKRLYDMTREARLRDGGSYTLAEELAQWDKQDHKCAVPGCTHPISSRGKHKYQVDHIFPVAKDGCNLAINIQCLCSFHNISKQARDPFEWARKKLNLSTEDYETLTGQWLAAYTFYIQRNPHRKKKKQAQSVFTFALQS